MKCLLLSLALTALLSLPAVSEAPAEFLQANQLLQQRKYAEALPLYQKLLQGEPDGHSLLFNAGIAAQQSGQAELALRYLLHLKELEPAAPDTRAALVRCYQALGRKTERNRELAEVQRLHFASTDPAEKSQPGFLRDIFRSGPFEVLCQQFYKPAGAMQLLYVFVSTRDGQTEPEELRIGVESSDIDTEMARELKQIGPKDRIYSLDGFGKGTHSTFEMFEKEPAYETIKAKVENILKGTARAKSSTHP